MVTLACLLLVLSASVRGAEDKHLAPAEEFLRQASAKLDNRTFGWKDREDCVRFLRNAKEDERLPFVLVLAQSHRVMEERPVNALMILGPVVTSPGRIAEWAKANMRGEEEALAKWREECYRARKEKWDHAPERPRGPFAPFPPLGEWKVDYRNAKCAVEIARCHMDLAKYQEALAIVNALGEKFEETPRVLASECGGDMMVRLQMYQKSVGFYEFGLKVLRAAMSYYGEGYTDEQKAIRARILRKLAEARRLLEVEKYGKGWVLYRDAEAKRRSSKAYLDAYLLYEDIRGVFPKTVWSEAASCYSIKCLLALSEPETVTKAKRTIATIERRLAEKKALLREAERAKVPGPARKEIEDAIKMIEARIARMKAVPTGKDAAALAERTARTFLKENEFGLYRGEVLLDIADFYLETRLDPQRAERWYQRAKAWLVRVGNVDAKLDLFEVPDKTKEVSAPPAEMKTENISGACEWIEPRIGAMVNRNACDWYLGKLNLLSRTKLGLCKFIAGDAKGAAETAEAVLRYDKFERLLKQAGDFNSYDRLRLGYERGWLFSPKRVVHRFRGRAKTALLVADYHCEIEDFESAFQTFRRLQDRFESVLDREAQAYVQYMLGRLRYIQFQDKDVLKYLEPFRGRKYRNTEFWAEARFTEACTVQNEKEGAKKACAVFDEVMKQARGKPAAAMALYHKAELLNAFGRYKESAVCFGEFLAKYPKHVLAATAKRYLAEMRQERRPTRVEKAR